MFIDLIEYKHVSGELEEPAIELEEISEPGVDYRTFRQVGLRADYVEIVTLNDYNSVADAQLAYQAAKALQSKSVAVEDQHGNVYTSVVVKSVNKVSFKEAPLVVGKKLSTVANYAQVLILRWVMVVNV